MSMRARYQASLLRCRAAIVFSGIGLAVCLLWHCLPCYAEDKIIAIVNDEVITQKDFSDFANFMRMELQNEYSGTQLEEKLAAMTPDMLNRLIDDRLIYQEAKKEKIRVDESRIKARIADLKKHYPTEADFSAALASQGLTLADIETRMREQLLTYLVVEYKIKSTILVSPAEVTAYYENNAAAFNLPERREFEVVKTPDQEAASQVYAQVQKGLAYDTVVKENASLQLNQVSAYKGGELKKEIEDAVFALKENEVSRPAKIDDSYYVFKLLRVIPPAKMSLADSRGKIYSILTGKKLQEAMAKWLAQVKSRAYIKIIQS